MLLSYHNDEWRSQKKMYVSVNIWVKKTYKGQRKYLGHSNYWNEYKEQEERRS